MRTRITARRRSVEAQNPTYGERLGSIIVQSKGPFDLPLSLKAAASFFPAPGLPPTSIRTPVQIGSNTATIEIWQPSRASGPVRASSAPALETHRLREIVKWIVSAELDLRPFYRLAAQHHVMGLVVRSLSGLKPLRPATIFEMAVIAITEQQLSLAAAFHIRTRLVRRFGQPVGDQWVFPSPQRLAKVSLRDLRACGLSQRKAEYLKALARHINAGGLDLEELSRDSDQRIRDALLNLHGFGEWSAQYILSRGFGRADCLPASDVGLRRVIGHYMAKGRRLTATELEAALVTLKPFRGLAAYYLAVHWRLRQGPAARPIGPRIATLHDAGNEEIERDS